MYTQSHQYPRSDGLSVSVVVYRPDIAQLEKTFGSLTIACRRLRASRPDFPVHLYLIDNGGLEPMPQTLQALRADGIDVEVISGQGNVGYGRGHNLAIERASSNYHLVLNPDIDLESDALRVAVRHLDVHPDIGLLTPWIGDCEGRRQYLCRRFPTVLDLFVRGFLPLSARRIFVNRLAHYEMQDRINDHDIVWDPPIVSGCFMLFRSDVLKKLGGFDPRYFLYFEDYDLSLRTHEVARMAYVPSVRVIHHGGGASRKGFAHIRMFAASAFKFYNRFGWRLW